MFRCILRMFEGRGAEWRVCGGHSLRGQWNTFVLLKRVAVPMLLCIAGCRFLVLWALLVRHRSRATKVQAAFLVKRLSAFCSTKLNSIGVHGVDGPGCCLTYAKGSTWRRAEG